MGLTGGDGAVERYKARLVAQGFNQRQGADYDETFCPVVRMESFRTLVALSTQHNLELHHVDVTTAFLNGVLEEEVFMRQPEGYTKPEEEHLVCKLSKSIYGLKQSPRCWNTALHAHLVKMNFEQLHSDPCIYRSKTEGDCFYIGVYVDDIVLAGRDEARIQEVKQMLARKFDIKDLGRLTYFLGMSVVQDQGALTTWIGQPAYTKKLLGKQKMGDCKPVGTPVSPGSHLVKATDDGPATVPVSCGEPNVPLCLYKTRSCLRCRHPCKILEQAKQKSLDSSQTSLEVPEGDCQPWHCLHKV